MRTLIVLLVAVIGVVGCTHNKTTLDDSQVSARTSTSNLAKMTPAGDLQAAYPGVGPTQLMQDAEGNWTNMPGPVGVLSVPLPSGGVAYIISPKDVRIAEITYTPDPNKGMAALRVVGLEANISVPLQQYVAAIEVHLAALQSMTKEEALATVEKWKIAAEITPTVADMLVSIITALL